MGLIPFSNGLKLLEEDIGVQQIAGEERQACAADRAGVAADGAFDEVRNRDALQVERLEGLSRRGKKARTHPGRKAAVDHGRRKIDDGNRGDDGLRKRCRRILNPYFERFAEIDPVVGGVPERLRVDAAFAQELFQDEDRGDFQQLRRLAVLAGDRQRADGAGGAGSSGKEGGVITTPPPIKEPI